MMARLAAVLAFIFLAAWLLLEVPTIWRALDGVLYSVDKNGIAH